MRKSQQAIALAQRRITRRDRDQKRHVRLARVDRIRRFQMHRHLPTHLLREADPPEKIDEDTQPPKGVTARGVLRKTTFLMPQSKLTFRCTVLFFRQFCLTNFNLTD